MIAEVLTPPAASVAIAELRAFLRIEGGGHADADAELAGAIRAATALCEAFIGAPLIARTVRERLDGRDGWRPLAQPPVRAIEAVARIGSDGTPEPLALADYAIDIDAAGRGWVRLVEPGGARVIAVDYVAGVAADWNGIPEPVRHGILRLAAHLRHDSGAAPPASITALWRPWRTMRLSAGARR